jgi:hypothetical protein
MAVITIRGTTTLIQQPSTTSYKLGAGGRVVDTWKGTDAVEVAAAVTNYRNAGYEVDTSSSGPVITLVATYTEDVEPDPIWSLTPHTTVQSIFETDRPFVLNVESTVRTSIEAKLKNPHNANLDFVPSTVDLNTSDGQAKQNAAARIYHYKQMGLDGREINILELKRTIVVRINHPLTWTITNTNCVLSTNVLIGYGVPVAYQSLMPSGGDDSETVTVEGYYAPSAGAMPVPWYLGWLERYPSVQNIGGGKVQVEQSWVYNRWLVGDDGLYDVVS